MLFFKPKPRIDEILPPPPPFPIMEFEEEKQKPKLFDELILPKKAKAETQEEKEFGDLFQEFEEEKPKAAVKKEKTKLKKLKIFKKEAKALKGRKKSKSAEDFEEDIDFELPSGLEEPFEKETELPETLEDFELDDFGKQINFEEEIRQEPKTKPKEILEAEEEIKSAIENIKSSEKTSFFKKFFRKKEKAEENHEEPMIPKISGIDDVSKIRESINRARDALMKFDLETAKKSYIEAMRIYNSTNPEEKAKVYNDIRDLYFERKSAEELKV